MASVAFPATWNGAMDVIGAESLRMSEDSFRLGLDLQGGAHLVYEADMSAIPESERTDALEGVRDVIERRVNAFGVSEPVVQTNIQGDHYRIIIELAGVFDVSEATKEIGETPILEFKIPNTEINLDLTPEQEAEIEAAQDEERTAALNVLDLALDADSLSSFVETYTIDASTKDTDGYIGFVDVLDPVFGVLAEQIEEDRLRTGIIDGLYESDSTMHIVDYLSLKEDVDVLGSHILLCHNESPRCTSERTKVEAQLLAEEIARDTTRNNFAEKAIEFSDDGSAEAGGDLDWLSRGVITPDFEEAIFGLEDGEISEAVETSDGYHVIYRRDSRPRDTYEIAHIAMPWTTASDILIVDPWMNTELSGEHVRSASVAFDQNTNAPYVVLNFNGEGGDLFGTITEDHVGQQIAIFLDASIISAPTVQQPIYGGEASITGGFTLEDAKTLSRRLNAGALPVPIELLSQQTVGPTLGAVSLERSVNAALIGFALVAVFMIMYYRLAGLLSVFALLVYAAVNMALYKWLGVTLTLSSIAGFILSVGMAVDANVLIFERLKEELRSGRDLPTAIDEGFRRAWTSIRDGNLTTLIAALVLFSMSTSFIKGFALTLALGIIVSMLTAILVTRLLLKWAAGFKFLQSHWLYSGNRKKGSR